jgi:hypothetical protein
MSNIIKSKKFTIVLMDKTFESNEDGFLDLNIIAKEFNLKKPSQWRNKERTYLEGNAKLHFGKGGVESGGYALADEDAVLFYAQWISIEFAVKVTTAFRMLRNGEIAKAYDIAQSTVNETAESAFEKWLSYSDTPLRDACGMLGIKRTMLFMSEAKKPNQLKSFIDRGILKHRNYGDKGSAIRVTSVGKHFIKDNIDKINEKLEEIYNERNF